MDFPNSIFPNDTNFSKCLSIQIKLTNLISKGELYHLNKSIYRPLRWTLFWKSFTFRYKSELFIRT